MAQLQSSAGSLPEALVKGMETFRAQLTGVVVLTGAAMQPTLNAGPAAAQGDRIEKLLVRLIPRPAANRTVFDGDVVAFASPIAGPASSPAVLVRRVAALEGDEMASDDAEDEAFAVPQASGRRMHFKKAAAAMQCGRFLDRRAAHSAGRRAGRAAHRLPPPPFCWLQGHCWVLADNEDLAPCDAVDSRTFGPLPLQNIQGRVMYYARDETDHGALQPLANQVLASASSHFLCCE